MTKRGVKPKATATLKLHGGYRHDRHGGRMDAIPPAGTPTKPANLGDAGSVLWDSILSEHEARGLLGDVDTAALTALCEAWSLYRASVEIAKVSPTDKDVRCAAVAYLNIVDKIGSKFGWTVSDRASIKIGDVAEVSKIRSRDRA